VSAGPTLIHLLYQKNAEQAGWIIQLLAGGVWLQSLEAANGSALLAVGQPKWLAAGNAAKLLGMVLLIPIGFASFGFPGAVVALASTELLHYLMTAVGVERRRVACLGQDVGLTALVLLTSALGLAVARFLAPAVRALGLRPAKLGTLLELVLITTTASAAWGYAYLLHRRHGPAKLDAATEAATHA
jgi:O-antigen/teichoic acid export membrane protein